MKRIVFVCLMMLGIMAKAQSGYQVGATVQDFNLKNVNGKNVALADYKDAKGYIIVFTCNTCPVAKAYQSRVEELNKIYASKGYPVIAINTNDAIQSPGDSYDKMQALAKEKNISYPYLLDPNHIITRKFGAERTPHTFVLTKINKVIKVAYIGAIDNDEENENPQKENYVKNAVNALLQNKKLQITNTKAIGCSIKWSKRPAAE